MVNLCSDNVAGALPAVLDALVEAGRGAAMPYGADPWSARLDTLVAEIFERPAMVFPVATGTAANSLALACLTPPWGAVYCHDEAHVMVDECGAPEFFTGGAKLIGIGGRDSRIDPQALRATIALAAGSDHPVHVARPSAVTITTVSEGGTLYAPAEVAAIADVCRTFSLGLHMDGARFAGTLAALGCSPADLTWKAGVDILSLGATKGGALAAEAVVVFDPALAEPLAYRRKKSGHLVSKMRFLSAQLVAWLSEGRWLSAARHANGLAQRLGAGLDTVPGAKLVTPVEANMAFVAFDQPLSDGLRGRGHAFYPWPAHGPQAVRLVTSFETTDEDVEAFLADARAIAAGR
ncbi:low specificity L-threonine aldolase [Rhodospirillum rubrum]|uniref:threonine aldolase family protein n=1 Tax=Rhodospirillum rubrum TaxID=1085 RepID=UPI00190755FE|nr:low specificity L-threonine aldolase [Rhodospirillum rubrum]MBK1664587.1 low specificity L-threonine aldolase [Rhodospirillum rubrum]MBK1676758.1 low specificity L-threonine aldolase [Rhodospirillum rubrum]